MRAMDEAESCRLDSSSCSRAAAALRVAACAARSSSSTCGRGGRTCQAWAVALSYAGTPCQQSLVLCVWHAQRATSCPAKSVTERMWPPSLDAMRLVLLCTLHHLQNHCRRHHSTHLLNPLHLLAKGLDQLALANLPGRCGERKGVGCVVVHVAAAGGGRGGSSQGAAYGWVSARSTPLYSAPAHPGSPTQPPNHHHPTQTNINTHAHPPLTMRSAMLGNKFIQTFARPTTPPIPTHLALGNQRVIGLVQLLQLPLQARQLGRSLLKLFLERPHLCMRVTNGDK